MLDQLVSGWARSFCGKRLDSGTLRLEPETKTSNDDHNLHDGAAQRSRGERGIYEPVHGKLSSLIATERHATGGAASQECHQRNRQGCSSVLDARELHHADRSAYGSGVKGTANKKLAAAAAQREQKCRSQGDRKQTIHNATSLHQGGLLNQVYTF